MSAFGALLAWSACAAALNPSLDISQYAHTSWTVRDGFSLGNIYAMADEKDRPLLKLADTFFCER